MLAPSTHPQRPGEAGARASLKRQGFSSGPAGLGLSPASLLLQAPGTKQRLQTSRAVRGLRLIWVRTLQCQRQRIFFFLLEGNELNFDLPLSRAWNARAQYQAETPA